MNNCIAYFFDAKEKLLKVKAYTGDDLDKIYEEATAFRTTLTDCKFMHITIENENTK